MGRAVNPGPGTPVAVWVGKFVLGEYGSAAVMGVAGPDQGDFELARKYNRPVRIVVQPEGESLDADTMTAAYDGDGVLVESGQWNGLAWPEANRKMTAEAKARGIGEGTVQYRLKDWGISRQRYWGTPIPMIHCPVDGVVPVPDEQLPVVLPKVTEFTGRGDSPLAHVPEVVNVTWPKCGGTRARHPARADNDVSREWA